MFAKAAILSDEMIATDAAAYTEQKQDRILRNLIMRKTNVICTGAV